MYSVMFCNRNNSSKAFKVNNFEKGFKHNDTMNEITKKNKAVILQTIISANQDLLLSLKKNYPKMNSRQLNIAILLKLDYSREETGIIIDSSKDAISEISALLNIKD